MKIKNKTTHTLKYYRELITEIYFKVISISLL